MDTPSDSTQVDHRMDRAADALWRRISDSLSEPWLDRIRDLRHDGDDVDVSLDIWSIALIAELKVPEHRADASTLLGRLRQLSDEIEGCTQDA